MTRRFIISYNSDVTCNAIGRCIQDDVQVTWNDIVLIKNPVMFFFFYCF